MTPEVAAGALDEGRLAQTANQIRQDIIEMLLATGSGHSAGPLGMADAFTTLYFAVLAQLARGPGCSAQLFIPDRRGRASRRAGR